MRRLFKYMRPYRPFLVVLVLLVAGQSLANLSLPRYMARIVDDGIVGEDVGAVWRIGLAMIGVALLGGACMVGVGFLAARIAAGFTRDLRTATFSAVEDFSLVEFNRFSTASLITRCTNDMQQIQQTLAMSLRLALMAPIMGVGALILAWELAPSMAWILAVAVVSLMTAIIALFAVAMPRFTRLQLLVDRLNLVAREGLTGIRVIRAFTREGHEAERFDAANRDLTRANLVVNRLLSVMQPVMVLVLNLTSVAIVWVGAHKLDAGSLQIGDMMAFMQFAMQAIFAFLMISMLFIMVPRSAVSARRVAEVLACEPVIRDPEHPLPAPHGGGRVEFRAVTFHYPGAEAPVLEGITFTAEPGRTTAFVGPTGSGKSTLVGLLLRLYDVSAGAVLLDGVDVRAMRQEDARARIGFVSQRAALFSGTIEANLGYGSHDADAAAIARAARIAQAADFIEALPDGYDHLVAQAGTNLSGGQKQRLAIARAIARDPDILVFDDSFSALDPRTDARLRAALEDETSGKTVLIVAQRIGTIRHADKIVVLEEGRIACIGRHAELLRTCRAYRDIAASQLSDEELAVDAAIGAAR